MNKRIGHMELKRSREFYTNILGRIPANAIRRIQKKGYNYLIVVDGYMEQAGDVLREFYSRTISDKVIIEIVKQVEKDRMFKLFGEPVWFEFAELLENKPADGGR